MRKTEKLLEQRLLSLYDSSEIKSFMILIMNHLYGFSYTDMLLNSNKIIDETDIPIIEEYISRLANQEPIQYILGTTQFCDLNIQVNQSVLIPRGETEELVQLVIHENPNFEGHILDIGTGSGCIALALKNSLKNASVWGCDISESALKTASENALQNQLEVSFFNCDVLAENPMRRIPSIDIIVSNPPYIRQVEKSEMAPNVLDFEPHNALFVPNNQPLLFYSTIANDAFESLKSGGKLYFEINESFGNETIDMLKLFPFEQINLFKDIHGKDRMIRAIKP